MRPAAARHTSGPAGPSRPASSALQTRRKPVGRVGWVVSAAATTADAARPPPPPPPTPSSSILHAALGLPPPPPGGPPTSRATVRAAYRSLARRTHPDVLPPDTPPDAAAAAAATLARARAAAAVLGDARSAASYARAGLGGLDARTAALFADEKADAPGPRHARPPTRGRDVGAVLVLSFEDSALGKAVPVRLAVDVPCAGCAGGGLDADAHATPCAECGGRGAALYSRTASPLALSGSPPRGEPARLHRLARGAPTTHAGPPGPAAAVGVCPACGGGGDAARGWCRGCGGRGLMPGVRAITVAIPPGTLPDATLCVPGAGGAGTGGGPPGDAFLVVAVEPSEHGFVRGGGGGDGEGGGVGSARDVVSTLRLGAADAVLGVEGLAVRTLRGRAGLRVPPGTQPGAVLALDGAGIAGGEGEPGSHLFVVEVVVPGLEELGEGGVAAAKKLRAYHHQGGGRRPV